MHLSYTSVLLMSLLSGFKANNPSEIPTTNLESFVSSTNMPVASTNKNTATTQQQQSVLLSTTLSVAETSLPTTSMMAKESSSEVPQSMAIDEISTENAVTKSLTTDASDTSMTSSSTQPSSMVDTSTKSLKASGIAPETKTEVPEASEAMPKTTAASSVLKTTEVTTEETTQTSVPPSSTTTKILPSLLDTTTKETASTNSPSPRKSFRKRPRTTTTARTKEDDPTSTDTVLEQHVFAPSSTPSIFIENITVAEEEVLEHNNVIKHEESTTEITNHETTSDKGTDEIVVGHKCYKIFQDSILWNDTDGGMLALKACPAGYQGSMYRPCFSSGKWGNVDYSECRLEHLGRMRHMIVHQVEKGMLGNMYVLAEEFSKYLSLVDMKSPMDRLEAFEILNTFLKVDMNLKMDKSRDTKYVQTLLHCCNELIKKKTVLFSPGSQENKLISDKAVEMVFDLTYFAEKSLRGLLKTQKKQVAFRSSPNVVLYLYKGKLGGQLPLMNFTSEYERNEEKTSIFNLENALERSAYALIWIKGLRRLLSTKDIIVNSDVAVATILSPLNSINRMSHPPTFDIGLRMEKAVAPGYTLKCGQLWNMSKVWNTKDCKKASVKGDIVTCRCHHLGSIALLLQENSQVEVVPAIYPVGKLISISCVISLFATLLTLITYYFLLHREEQHLSIFIFVNMITCLLAVQLMLLYGVNKGGQNEICMSFAIMLHYLFMVLCCWVVAYGVNLLRRLRTKMEYSGRPRDYCAACWMAPGIMLAVAFILNPDGYETQLYCWMNIERGILWSFVFPVTALILVNTGVMIVALKTFNEQMPYTHRIEICKTRNSLRAGITLLPFIVVNWFFGILAVEDSYNLLLQTIFSCTNAMQGILTFIFFCLMDANIVAFFRMKITVVTRRPKTASSMRLLKKSGSFPILDRPLMHADVPPRTDCTPLLADRAAYHDTAVADPCCSNIRV